MDETKVTRRALAAAGGLIAVAGFAGVATAAAEGPAPSTDGEKANLKLVRAFIASWSATDFDAKKAMPRFLAQKCSVRLMQTMPPATTPAAVAAGFDMSHGERLTVKFLSTYAKGPIVTTHRIDTLITPGKADQDFEVVGVFYVQDGKIKEWTDYLLNPPSPAPPSAQ